MSRRARTLALLAVLLAAAAAARAEPGQTGAVTLSRPLGARAGGMAEAFAGVPGGLDSLTYNPAGLSGLETRELRTDYTDGIVDDSFSFLGFAQKVGPAVLAAGGAYYDAGTISLNLSDGTQARVKTEQDWVGSLAASYDLGAGFSVGGVAKYYRLTLAQAASASGGAFDGGAMWRTPIRGLSLGGAFQNAGPDVKFEQQGDPLPLTLRAGAAYEIRGMRPEDPSFVEFDHFILTADAIKPRYDRVTPAVGTEMRMTLGKDSHAALRLGYLFNSDIDGFAIGVGLREGHFVLDYALGVKRTINNDHHFSLGVRF